MQKFKTKMGNCASNKKPNSSFGVWLRTTLKPTTPLSLSASHLDQLMGKPRCLLLGTTGVSKPCEAQSVCRRPHPAPPLATVTPQASLLSLLFRDVYGAPWKPALHSPESLRMWGINLFIASWHRCGIIGFDNWTKLCVCVGGAGCSPSASEGWS